MNTQKKPSAAGHRERLRNKLTHTQLADYELLELVIGGWIPRCDVRERARMLIKEFGGVHQALCQPIDALTRIPGIGKTTAERIQALHELMLLDFKGVLTTDSIMHNYKVLVNYCLNLVYGKKIEEFHVMYLDGKLRMLQSDLHSTGTLTWSAVYSREIVRRAIELNAHHVILLHNHPTAGVEFSPQDAEITTELKNRLAAIDVDIYDHYLVSGGILYSAREKNILS